MVQSLYSLLLESSNNLLFKKKKKILSQMMVRYLQIDSVQDKLLTKYAKEAIHS